MAPKVDHPEPQFPGIGVGSADPQIFHDFNSNSIVSCCKDKQTFVIYKTFEAKKRTEGAKLSTCTLSVVEGIKSDVRYLAPLLMVFFQTFRMALSHLVFSLLCVLNTSRKAYQLRLQLPLNQQLLMYSFLFPFLFLYLFSIRSKP